MLLSYKKDKNILHVIYFTGFISFGNLPNFFDVQTTLIVNRLRCTDFSKSVYLFRGGGCQNCPKFCPRGLCTAPIQNLNVLVHPRAKRSNQYSSIEVVLGAGLHNPRWSYPCLICGNTHKPRKLRYFGGKINRNRNYQNATCKVKYMQ